jgi:hypothetical protein
MTSFDEREKSFEAKFQQDQELAFKVRARRRRLLGLWAAERLGIGKAEAEAYAHAIAESGLAHHGDDDAVARIMQDFAAKGVVIDATRVALELEHCDREAKAQLGAAS